MFTVNSATIASGSDVSYATAFINGTDITLSTSTSIGLASGHIYEVSHLTLVTGSIASFVQITPNVNASAQTNFTARADTGALDGRTSVSGTFLADARSGALTLNFVYTGGATATSPSGNVSVVEIQ